MVGQKRKNKQELLVIGRRKINLKQIKTKQVRKFVCSVWFAKNLSDHISVGSNINNISPMFANRYTSISNEKHLNGTLLDS